MKIVFMGTPDFAVPSLDTLVQSKHEVVGAVTAIDKPAGRGKKIQMSPIKQYALDNGIPVLQPEKLKAPEFISELKNLNADLFVVVAFRMLPEVVWSMPVKGTFNLHGSLLPQYRGAAPINWAIINGEKETGATTFFIEQKIDTGNILFYERIPIGENTTAGGLHDDMMMIGAELVLKTVEAIDSSSYKLTNQEALIESDSQLKDAPKINKETCKINWAKNTKDVHNHIRGLSPFPGAFTELQTIDSKETIMVKIYESRIADNYKEILPGQIQTDNKSYMNIGTNNGAISVYTIQFPGKKRLHIEDFLRGTDPTKYKVFI